VLTVEIVHYDHSTDPQRSNHLQKAALDELHLRKIELADEVLVLNVNGYVGESTRREISYAEQLGKPVHWLEPVKAESSAQRQTGASIQPSGA
jgi:nucleoside 2-deoxyribosyltransferase